MPPVRDAEANKRFEAVRAATYQSALLKGCCGNCKYRVDGTCHRNPPVISVVTPYVDSKRAMLKDIAEYRKGEWPYVDPEDWCGEWVGAAN